MYLTVENTELHKLAMDYPQVLRAIMVAGKYRQGLLAKRLRVSQPTVSRWLRRESKPEHDQHERIVLEGRRLGVLPAVANEDRRAIRSSLQPAVSDEPDLPSTTRVESAEIPELDLFAGANYSGGFPQEEVETDGGHSVHREGVRATWGIPKPFLRDALNVRPDRVHMLPIKGDSMVDTLFDGDRVLIDLDDRDVSQGGIFAVRDDLGTVIIKQVELVRGSDPVKILCTSRNVRYRPFELELGQGSAEILGRVACRITRL